MNVPGSEKVIDNPDTIYRTAKIIPGASYIIRGQRAASPPIDENYSIYDATGATLANIAGSELAVNVDGTFTITADTNPAGSRLNHLQINASAAKEFFTRNTLKNWGKEIYTSLSLECTSGCDPSAAESFDTLVSNVVKSLDAVTNNTFKYYYNGYIGRPVNTLSNVTKGGTAGYLSTQAQSRGIWSITDNQALIVNVNLGGAKYFCFPIYDKWMITPDIINHTMSLNNGQSLANANGTYTFVMAARDPGVYNWIDTNGLHEGLTLLRWQLLPSTPPATGNASATMKLVTFATLNASLPAGTVFVTAAQRRQQIADRVASYASRYATDSSDTAASTGCVLNPEAGLTWEMVAMFIASIAFLAFKLFRNRKQE